MGPHNSEPLMAAAKLPIIAVCGGLNVDVTYQDANATFDNPDLSRAGIPSLTFGGKGANTSIAIYRASRRRPRRNLANILNKMDCEVKNMPLDGRDRVGSIGGASEEPTSPHDQNAIEVCINGAVGDDDHGAALRAKLSDQGIDVSGLQTAAGQTTGCCTVYMDDEGRGSGSTAQGANMAWKPSDYSSLKCLTGQTGRAPDLVVAHLAIRREEIEKVLLMAAGEGVDTLFNPAPDTQWTPGVYGNLTHLIVNLEEFAKLTDTHPGDLDGLEAKKTASGKLIKEGVKNVVVTLGMHGAFFVTSDGKSGVVKASKDIVPVNTQGAGDTFIGNYAVDYVRQKRHGQWHIEHAVQKACRAAGCTIQSAGAQDSIPWSDEVDGKL